jgi:sporulation protein YlmC with PRC-barrel domain
MLFCNVPLRAKNKVMAASRQTPDQGTPRNQAPDGGSRSKLTARLMLGEVVQNPRGEKLGNIDNLIVNESTGAVEAVVIQTGSFLGVGGKLINIPFAELRFHASRRTFILDRTRDDFERSSGSEKSNWPEENVHKYFKKVISKI